MSRFRRVRSQRPRLRLTLEQVEGLVEQALDELPEELAELLDNVVVMVEEEPADEDLREMGIDPEDPEARDIFGLYQGVPHTERDSFYEALPDRVLIYAGTLRRACSTRREAVDEIRKTLLHELGHHFGMEEDDMPY